MKINPAKGFDGFYKRFLGGDKPRPYKKEIVYLRLVIGPFLTTENYPRTTYIERLRSIIS